MGRGRGGGCRVAMLPKTLLLCRDALGVSSAPTSVTPPPLAPSPLPKPPPLSPPRLISFRLGRPELDQRGVGRRKQAGSQTKQTTRVL